MEVHTADDTGDRKLKKTGKEENRRAAKIAMNE